MRSSGSGRRSSSLQRPRAGSAKRGQRSSTPSRRLSDLAERPAWDATSSNFDKYKLTAQEQERRKASRVSKNRPLASDINRSFVEAWAKEATGGSLYEHGDTQPDQGHPQSSGGDNPQRHPPQAPAASGASALPIDYSSVVGMLRAQPAPSSVQRHNPGARVERHAPHPAESGSALADGDGAGGASRSPSPSPTRSGAGGAGQEAPSYGGAPDGRRPDAAAAAARAPAPAAGAAGSAAAPGSAAPRAAAAKPADAAAAIFRGDVSVTPAALRPRFTQAEATTIISVGEDGSDVDDGADDAGAWRAQHAGGAGRQEGGYEYGGSTNGSPSPGYGEAPGDDRMAAAFEAALFGSRHAASIAAAAGGGGRGGVGAGPRLSPAGVAWAPSGGGASHHGFAAAGEDVERRLRAVEGALSGVVAPADMAELRAELRKVQEDNARLRQELGSFSTHASTLLTQLQAQVQQLLRGSGGGSGTAAGASIAPAAQLRAAPPFPTALDAGPGLSNGGAAAGYGAAAATAATAVPVAPAFQQYQQQQQQQHQAQQHHQAQPVHVPLVPAQGAVPLVRRNIFADVDVTALRGSYPVFAAPQGGGGGASAADAEPATAAAAGRVGSGGPALAAAPAPPQPPAASLLAPVGSLEAEAVVLPAFATFRRSAGAAAFTAAARPVAAAAASSGAAPPAEAAAPDPSGRTPPAGPSNVHTRAFPTSYQPRSLGGPLPRPPAAAAAASSAAALDPALAHLPHMAAAAGTGGLDAGAGRAAGAGVSVAGGLAQPLVFSVGPAHRPVRAPSGLSADNSMSLSAHTAAAARARAAGGAGR